MKNFPRKILIFGTLLLLAAACQSAPPRAAEPPNNPPANSPAAQEQSQLPQTQQPFTDAVIGPDGQVYGDIVSYKGENGKSALELLKAKYPGKVETTQSSYGEFVNVIDGIKPDSQHFWAFYINDKLSNVGAGSYITKDSETISWKLEQIKN